MKHYNVSLNEVIDVVKEMNQNVSGGIINDFGNEYIIRGMLSTNNVSELKKAVVKPLMIVRYC